MIWLYWLACILPWSLVSPLLFLRDRVRRADFRPSRRLPDERTLYLILWAVSPLLFFSLARNILPAYVLPGLPTFALLLAGQWSIHPEEKQHPQAGVLVRITSGVVFVFMLACVLVSLGFGPSARSQKELVLAFNQQKNGEETALVYLFKRPFSARFYSRGKAEFAKTQGETKRFSGNGATDYFALSNSRFEKTPHDFQARVTLVGRFHSHLLVRENIP